MRVFVSTVLFLVPFLIVIVAGGRAEAPAQDPPAPAAPAVAPPAEVRAPEEPPASAEAFTPLPAAPAPAAPAEKPAPGEAIASEAAEPASAAAGGEDGAPPPAPGKDEIALNFSGTNLREAIRVFEQYSGKRFLFDDAVVGKRQVFLLSSEPIPAEYLDDVFESILEIHGLTLIRSGEPKAELYKIVEIKTAAGKATPTFTAATLAEAPGGDRVITLLYQLKYMLADQVAEACKNMTSVPEGVQAIPGTNLLRVTDYASNVKRIGTLLDELDKTGPRFIRETIKLRHADPAELVEELRPILDIENRVFIAELERQAEFRMQQIFGRREGQQQGPPRRLSPINLQAAMTVAAVPRLGAVIVAATEEKIEDLKRLIETLDIQDPDEKLVEYYALKRQSPSRLARTLSSIFADGAAGERPGGGGRPGGERPAESAFGRAGARRPAKAFAIMPEEDAGRIIVVAPRRVHDEMKPIIERLDATPDEEERELRYFPVKHADLEALAGTIGRIFGLAAADEGRIARWMQRRPEGGGEGRAGGPVRSGAAGGYAADLLIPDHNLGALIVIAGKEALDKIGAMVEQLDVAGGSTKTIEYYSLRYIRPDDASETLTALFGAGRRARRGPREAEAAGQGGGAVVVMPKGQPSTLIVLAEKDTHAEIGKVLANLDVEGVVLELKYHAVVNADPGEIAATIGRLFNLPVGSDGARFRRFDGREGARSQPGKSGISEEPVVIPDQNLNALIVLAEKKTQELVADALRRLDEEGPGQRVIEHYRLAYARPEAVAQQLQTLFSGSRRAPRAQRQWAPWESGGWQGADRGRQLVIVPDEKLGTLMVAADKETHGEIKRVLANLDVESAALELKYYPVAHADAAELAQTIGRLHKLSVGSDAARLRRFDAPDGTAGRPGRGGVTDEPVVIPDQHLNALVVLADGKTHELVAAALKELDVEGPGERTIQYYNLKYAAADTVARQLEALFGAGGPAARGTRRWGGPEQSVRQTFRGGRDIAVVADAKLATLMVLADRETHAEIKKVLLNLDVKGAELELKYYPVAHAEPAQLAQTIGRLFKLPVGAEPASRRRFQPYEEMWMGARGEDGKVSDEPAVIPDRNLNALIVLAEGKTQELVAAALKDLDVAGPGERTIEHYRLKYARPETVAQQLLSLFNAGRRTSRAQQWGGGWSWGGWDGGARESRDAREEIVITSDAKIATLMVLADAETHAEIKKVLANLDVESVLLELKYYPITRATLRDIAQTVGRLFNLPVAAEAAPSGQFAPRRDGAAGAARGGLPEDPLIVPDANLNALIILADKKTHELIAPALLTLDVRGPGERVTRFYRITHTSVAEVAATLTAVFGETRGGAAARPPAPWQARGAAGRAAGAGEVVVVAAEELSTVVVSASEELHKEIAEVVESLDTPSIKDSVLRYYKIENSELEDIADTVSTLFGLTKSESGTALVPRRPAAPGRGQEAQRSPYTDERVVLVDYNLGSLLIVAPLEVQTEIEAVIKEIDSLGPGKREIAHYRVPRTNVREIAATLAGIFDLELASAVPRAGAPRAAAAREARKSLVIPNETLGAVIVVAPAELQKRIAEVIAGLETIGPDENELQYYTIERADLIEAANIISQVFGIPLGTVETAFRARGQQSASDLLTKERVVIPNENLKTLLVVAPREMQKEIADTVKRIDTVGPRDNVFKMYEVAVSEVTTAAQTISQLFDLRLLQGGAAAARARTTSPLTGPKLTTQPFIMPDEEIGALIINAPEEIHKEIAQVIEKLVTIGRQEKMSIRFYRLKNTNPEEVAVKIGNLFNITVGDVSTALRRTTTPGAAGATTTTLSAARTTRTTSARNAYAARRGRFSLDEEEGRAPGVEGPAPAEAVVAASSRPGSRKEFYFEGESVVIPDTNLSSLILIAPEYIHEEVKTVLATLDVRRPQVLFEVAILDVKNDGEINFGTEWTTIDPQGGSRIRGSGFSNFGAAERDHTAGAGFPDLTTVPADMAGVFVGITKGEIGNVPLLIHMLQRTTDVNIRSTPLLLVNDNQEASFSSLQEEPTTTTSQGTSTTKVSFGGFVEAGTVLRITPHVSEGNYIRVDIDLKADNFYGKSMEPGIPPPRASNQLVTSITVPDSRTVVIGGLTTTKRSTVVTGVPLLSQIPLLGYLFSSTTEEDITTRLFLFIKPQILDDVDFKDLNQISVGKSFEVQKLTGEEIVSKTEEDEALEKYRRKAATENAAGAPVTAAPETPKAAETPVSPETAIPAGATPAEATSAATTPTETTPAEATPAATTPAATTPAATTPAATTPAATTPAEAAAVETTPAPPAGAEEPAPAAAAAEEG
ncbi:MAG: putative type II secretion system protein D precursor [Planctomycetes bacterium ADurb.Bin069]|nr:MAG: putative type II secretion system protein D precursor [Planctomycetes bacterium ADurb.Bin069]